MEDNTTKRERILRAAAQVFATNGFHQSTIEQIAESAGVGKGTVYLYFKGKDGLFDALIYDGLGMVVERMADEAAAAECPRERLELLAIRHLQFIVRNLPVMKVLFQQAIPRINTLKPEVEARVEAYKELFAATLREGVEKGLFNSVDPEIAAITIIGGLNLLGTSFGEGRLDATPESCQQQALGLIFNGLEKSEGGSKCI